MAQYDLGDEQIGSRPADRAAARPSYAREARSEKNGLQLDVRTLDLSTSGIGILSDGPLVIGTNFVIRCLVPTGGARKELVASARVIHSVFSGTEGSFVVGLAFVAPSAEVTELVATALR